MAFREVLAALRRGWWLSLLGLVLGAVVALSVSLLQAPGYTSHTQFFVSTTDSATPSDVFEGSQFSQQRVASYERLLTGEELAGRVIDRLGLALSPRELAERVRAEAVPETVLIDVTVTDPSPERAQQIAGALGDEFRSLAAQLEAPSPTRASPVKVTVTQTPEVPLFASSPPIWRNLALGVFVGLLLGVGTAVVRVRMDRSVRDVELAADLTGAPVLGLVIRDEELRERHSLARNSRSRVAENFRQLRTNLQFLNVDKPPRVILISSAVPAEGKTTVAVNLALSFAESGRQVALVDGDLRRPRVTSFLGLSGSVGLTNVLAGSAELDDALQPHDDGRLKVVPAGPTPPNPSELLSSDQMSRVIDQLRGKYEFVLIDASPLLPVADARGIAVVVDGVVLCVRHGSTSRDELQQARMTLDGVGARLLGSVINAVPPRADIASAHGYAGSYDPQPDRAVPQA